MKYSLIPVIRKDQINSSGECPIYIRYTAYRNSTSFPVKHTIPVNLWDESAKLPKLKSPKFKEIYADIERIQESLTQSIEEFISKHNRLPDGKELKIQLSRLNNPVQIQNELKGPTIKEDLIAYIKLREQEARSSTITVYKSTLLKWKQFEEKTKKVYFRSDINGGLFQDFRLFLLNSGIQLSTVGKYVKTIKSYVNTYLLAHENVNVDSTYRKVTVDREEKNNFEILDEIELENLKEVCFYSRYKVDDEIKRIDLSDRERLIGQMFLFMCNTGVPYGDLILLNFTNLKIEKEELTELKHLEEESEYFVNLEYERVKIKAKTKCIVPIVGVTIDLIISRLGLPMENMGHGNIYLDDNDRIEILKSLLDDFKQNYELLNPSEKLIFPYVSNASFNREIKDLMQKIGVDKWVPLTFRGKNKSTKDVPKYKRISAHTARRTYITHSLRKGVLPDIVMSTTGHKKVQTMSGYHKHDPASINREFRKKIKN
jgi:integrase